MVPGELQAAESNPRAITDTSRGVRMGVSAKDTFGEALNPLNSALRLLNLA